MATLVAGVAIGAALTALGGYTLYKLLAYLKRRSGEEHHQRTFQTPSGDDVAGNTNYR